MPFRSQPLLLLAIASTATATAVKRYGIVFDAGSSGTRIHVYTWQTGGGGAKDAFDLVSDDLLKIKPGLSAYKDKPSEAGASLAPLIEYAKAKIPAEQVASTPVFLMATAGLRMVGEAAKDAILASVCSHLSSSGFLFKCEWATLLDGRDEGLYGWVTVNYLLDSLYPGGQDPAGIIDLGGGSVQIVYPTTATDVPADLSQRLSFGPRQHSTYVKSHLGYGLDAARSSILDLVLETPSAQGATTHPCLPQGASVAHKGSTVAGGGDYKRCKKLTKSFLKKGAPEHCPHGKHRCSIGGTYQPPLPSSFYGFSYLFDRTAAIGLLDGKPTTFGSAKMTRDDIEHAAKAICGLDKDATAAKFASTNDASKSANFCGDVVYLAGLLDVLGFDDDRTLTMTNKIKDVELVWTLGAMLAKSAELANGPAGDAAAATASAAAAAHHPSQPLSRLVPPVTPHPPTVSTPGAAVAGLSDSSSGSTLRNVLLMLAAAAALCYCFILKSAPKGKSKGPQLYSRV